MPTASSGSPPLRHASTIYSYYNSSKPSVNNNCSLWIFFIGCSLLSRAALRLLQIHLFSLTVRLSAASPHKLQNRPDQQAAEKNASPNQPSAAGAAAARIGSHAAERHTAEKPGNVSHCRRSGQDSRVKKRRDSRYGDAGAQQVKRKRFHAVQVKKQISAKQI